MPCITPFTVTNKTGQKVPVPCGKCPDCKGRRTSGWSFRLMQQDKISQTANFITLTYDTDHVPITRNGFMSLNKRHVQLFYKRLRKAHSADPIGATMPAIKYYTVGEYGGKTQRPHYHAIIFNAHIPLIQEAWKYGSVHYGTVTGASVGYTLKYMQKESKIPMHRNDDRLREFSLMSKGIGENYLTKQMIRWHKQDLDNRMYLNIEEGKKISMPRYYKDKIYSEMERKRVAFFAIQTAEEQRIKREKKMYEIHGDSAIRVQIEVHMHQFKTMYKNAEQNRDKI